MFSDDPLTYEDLKALVEERGRPLKTLIAQADHTDPWMAGVPARKTNAEWLAALWRGNSWRRSGDAHPALPLFAGLASAGRVRMPEGERYLNTDECYKFLTAASIAARHLDLIDARDVADQRNEPAKINLRRRGEGSHSSTSMATLIDTPRRSFEPPDAHGHRAEDPTALCRLNLDREVHHERRHRSRWPRATASTCSPVPARPRSRAASNSPIVPTRSGARCASSTSATLIRPVGPCRSRPRVRSSLRLRKNMPHLDVQVRDIALTLEQCRRYRLPRTPIKEGESRGAKFEARFGEGATELDALEALHPGELAWILEREILRYYDTDLATEVESRPGAKHRPSSTASLPRFTVSHADQIQELRDEHARVLVAIRAYKVKARPILAAIQSDLRDEAPVAFDWPDGSFAAAEDEDPLFDSTRDYIEQIDRYKEHKDEPTERWTETRVCEHCKAQFTALKSHARFCSKNAAMIGATSSSP